MSVVLSIVAVAVLLLLIIVSAKRLLDERAAQKQADARAYTGAAEAQHERSLSRRAGVRASSPERARTTASDTDS
jgi:heme exporter protein D